MKKLILILVVSVLVQDTFAQLTTRENNDFTPKLGTLPSAGDAALQFTFPIVDLSGDDEAGLYTGNALQAGEMLTFKYYLSDENVLRVGLRLASDRSRSNGTAADSSDSNTITDFDIEENFKSSSVREYNLAAGIEKHFTNQNIFDVYAGGEALIGLGKDKFRSEETFFNGDIANRTATTSTKVFGLGGVVGFNVFIAELPISLGLEYGLSAKWVFGGKTKVEEEFDIEGGADYTTEYITQDVDGFGNADLDTFNNDRQYSDLSRRSFNMDTNNSVKVNLNIYFGTKSK